jgi:hypothetical protein
MNTQLFLGMMDQNVAMIMGMSMPVRMKGAHFKGQL